VIEFLKMDSSDAVGHDKASQQVGIILVAPNCIIPKYKHNTRVLTFKSFFNATYNMIYWQQNQCEDQ